MKRDRRRDKIVQDCLKQSVVKGRFDEKKIISFAKLFSKLPLSDAIAYLNEYKKGLKRLIDEQTIVVESAVSLNNKQQQDFKKMLAKNFKLNILNYKFLIDSSLLGGIRVRIGDEVMDSSVRNNLEQLKNQIVKV